MGKTKEAYIADHLSKPLKSPNIRLIRLHNFILHSSIQFQKNQMKYCLFILCIALCQGIKAQSPEDSVKATVNQLFTAMQHADAALLVSCFADSAILQTIADKNGKVQIKTESVDEFAQLVAKAEKGSLDERIRFDVIRIDGALAIVWTPYQFYYKGNFSHCGVNSFQLVRINGAWKIQYLIDTRRKEGCEN